MAADLLFFSIYVNWPYKPHFRVKILLNFAHTDEARRANFHENKRIIYQPPFMKKVYRSLQHELSAQTNMPYKKLSMP